MMSNLNAGGHNLNDSPTQSQLNRLTIPFSFGDATPAVIYTTIAGQTLFTVQIVIQVPFNGSGAALSIGDAGQSDRLMKSNQNDPKTVMEYETNPCLTYSTATPLLLTIAPGAGCTQGSGYVLLEV